MTVSVHTYTRSKTGDTVYCAVYYGPDGRRKTEKVRAVPQVAPKKDHERARAAATNHAHVQRCAVENETWTDPKADKPARLTFAQLVKRFLKNYRTRSGSMTYWEERTTVWLRHLGTKSAALTVADADRFKRERAKECSPSTLRKDLSNLSTMYRWARARRLVKDNPFDPDLIKRPPKGRPRPNPLSDAEAVALLDACPDWLAPMVELALATGADRGELVGLNWNRHVDKDRKRLILPRGKTGVGRTLPYGENATCKRILAEAGKVRHTSGRVFLHGGQPVDLQAVKSAMRRAWAAVFPCQCQDRKRPHTVRQGCPTRAKGRPWKSLRATFATRKTEAGWDVPTLAALMGLTTAHVLEHYVKPSGTHLAAAMADKTGQEGVQEAARRAS